MGLCSLRRGGPSLCDFPRRKPHANTHKHTHTRFRSRHLRGRPGQHLLTPVFRAEGFGWTEKAAQPSESERSSAPQSALGLSSALLSTRTLRQRVGRCRGTGRHRASQSVSSSILRLSESTVLFVSHRSFKAPMLRLRCVEGFAAAANFCTLKWRSIFVERQWLCPPQGRATYTAEPGLWMQACCCCCCC